MKIEYPLRFLTLITGSLGLIVLLFYLYPTLFYVSEIDYSALLLFFILIVLLECYPIKINEAFFSLRPVITLVLFIQFGVTIELILSHIGYFASILLTQRAVGLKHILNHFMYFWMSILSAFMYHISHSMLPSPIIGDIYIIPILVYMATSLLVNAVLLNWTSWIINRPGLYYNFEDFKYDSMIAIFTIPMTLLLLVAYRSQLGLMGAIIVSIPILIIAAIFKLSNDVQRANLQMKIIHQLASSFTSELDMDKSLDALVRAIRKLYVYDTCCIYRIDADKQWLIPLRFDARGSYDVDEVMETKLPLSPGLSGKVARTGRAEIMNSQIGTVMRTDLPEVIQRNRSLLSVPLKVKDTVIGVITIGSYKENGFSKKELTLIEILANYAATSIENAKAFGLTERRALMDELTGLFNYRGFEQQLDLQLQHMSNRNKPLALLVIDVDFFKSINDRFGHLTGNHVLQHLATLLQSLVRKQDIVSRYGGEEFTIILPETDEEAAFEIAERIRQGIHTHPKKVANDLDPSQDIYITITVSIGVAIFPHHAEDGLTLLRHADRAMYVGAKKAGRNRVSVYDAT